MLQLADVQGSDVVTTSAQATGASSSRRRRSTAASASASRSIQSSCRRPPQRDWAGVADRVRFVNGNLFTADIHEANVVTLYLLQSINERLRPKLVRELKPGTRVVSHVFNMGPEWPPQKTIEVGASRVFLWTIAER
jgi:hypothetical protein